MRGVGLIGVDGMGSAATGVLNGVPVAVGNNTAPGSIIGEILHGLTSNEMPSHFHGASIADPTHAHGSTHSGLPLGYQAAGPFGLTTSEALVMATNIFFAISGAATGVRVSGNNGVDTTNSAGGNQSHNTVHRSMTVYWNLAQ